MAGPPREGRFSLTLEEALRRALALDARTDAALSVQLRGSPVKVLSEVRAYLIRRSEEMDTRNNPIQLLKFRRENNGMAVILLGPTFDKGPTAEHFRFDSGARLSFGLALRGVGHNSQVVSYRFHYHLPDGGSPQYLRFDLNESPHENPLSELRCHLHPGSENVRIPLSLHDPIEILDRIFFGIDPAI